MEVFNTIWLTVCFLNVAFSLECKSEVKNVAAHVGPTQITCPYPKDSCVKSSYTVCGGGTCVKTTADGCIEQGSNCQTSTCDSFQEALRQQPNSQGMTITECKAKCCQSSLCNGGAVPTNSFSVLMFAIIFVMFVQYS